MTMVIDKSIFTKNPQWTSTHFRLWTDFAVYDYFRNNTTARMEVFLRTMDIPGLSAMITEAWNRHDGELYAVCRHLLAKKQNERGK